MKTKMYCPASTKGKLRLDTTALRSKFPIFRKHEDLVYLDSAATGQKPDEVLAEINRYYTEQCANAGRAAYAWSTQLEKSIEAVRARVANFIGGEAEDLAFTSGATESLNTVALIWGLANLKDGDEVLLCLKDHKSAILPWYNLKDMLAAMGRTINIKTFDIHEVGDYDLKSIAGQLTPSTRLLAMSHIHHVFGLDMEVSEIRKIVGDQVLISLDASQSIGHTKVDVAALGADFLSFSGHKMFAAPGTGILWINPEHKNNLQPIKLGGKSKAKPGAEGLIFSHKNTAELLEAGTQNIPAILSLGKAVDFVETIGQDAIEEHVSELTVYLYSKLANLPGIVFAPGMGICRCERGFGILSFRFEQIANIDLAFLLDSENIMVRTGDHCVYLQNTSEEYLRVSMHLYNRMEDIDRLIAVLAGAVY
jgi:cysteine desulfurase / selenocysteine lyase